MSTFSAVEGIGVARDYLTDVLVFQAAHGGLLPRSIELEYAVRRMSRAALRAGHPREAASLWFFASVAVSFGTGRIDDAMRRAMAGWIADEYEVAGWVGPTGPGQT